ncbi:hypothetical protein SAMN05428938_6970 [Streptomyces sp. KS_5]|nr:hypothetical protein SAMN05216482_1098 [Streptomyces sp. PAN_FS17]SEE06609.1 hypothetical protein SAMN05428938_6970 [Streptomyces sp. KS_5]
MRAVNGDWAKFTDAVRAAAPQVVIEEQTDPTHPRAGTSCDASRQEAISVERDCS